MLAKLLDVLPAQILDNPFQLADAQLLIAKQEGFDSWADLKNGVGQQALPSTSGSKRLLSVQPFLYVSDVDRACDYYSTVLGFKTKFKYGEPPFYAVITRDDVEFSVRSIDQYLLDIQRTRRREEELPQASILVEDAKSLFQEYMDAGAEFYQVLRTEPWGSKSFTVEDPDGNLVGFTTLGKTANGE